MLVLSRRRGEQIRVPGCDLLVTVLELSGGRVRLGFSAPDDVAVFREEVWARIMDEAEVADGVSSNVPRHDNSPLLELAGTAEAFR